MFSLVITFFIGTDLEISLEVVRYHGSGDNYYTLFPGFVYYFSSTFESQ